MIAAWSSAALRGQTGVEHALDVLGASDLLRPVQPPGVQDSESLVHAIARWRRLGITGWWYAPVEPGDVAGVPAPITQLAAQVGAAMISIDGSCRALLLNDGLIEMEVSDHGRPPPESVSDAERHLLTVMSDSTEVMAELDVAPWNRDQVTRLQQPVDPFPPGADSRAERLAERSLRVLELTELALEDDGGSRTAHENEVRTSVLRTVRRAARHAHAVAWNTPVMVPSRPR
jgi:hypothetical protein